MGKKKKEGKKRAKYGFNIHALSDASVRYTSSLEIYAGKQPQGA
jgi:hypothetical protein